MEVSQYAGKNTHSIKVPRLYKVAAKIVQQVKEKGGSPKGLIFRRPHPNVKGLYALVMETLKHSAMLDHLFKETRFLERENKINYWLASVLFTELMWGKKLTLHGESKPVKTVLRYASTFQELMNTQVCKSLLASIEQVLPRAVRVNTLVISLSKAIEYFTCEGLIHVQTPQTYEKFLSAVKYLANDEFITDFHVPDLLIFNPDINLTENELYINGSIFLQSKASCMASFLLSPKPGSVVLDLCAAPGMKTTHLAAIMKNKGTIYAIEKDRQRVSTLNKIVKQSKATCILVERENAMNVMPEKYPNVEYILVDPTCSGSGTYRNQAASIQKINKLAGFQTAILKFAMVNFPEARRVVYSTCSINPQENEVVVQNVLRLVEDFEVKKVMSNAWISRGNPEYLSGENCIYAKPEVDLTTGFFVAVFERKKSS